MIVLANLRMAFRSTVAVRDVSFTAPNGQVTGLLGPNGAGKTTTLRLLTGLLTPDAGSVLVDGLDVHVTPREARARLGVVPEHTGLYDRLTVREHVEYGVRLHGHRGPGAATLVDAALARSGLSLLAGRPAGTLSLGERRRVALARALAHGPVNVVLDEPTNGLDVPGVRDVRAEIRRLAAAGCAVVVSTHVMQEVSALCDRVIVLARGRLVAEGTPAELRQRTGHASMEDAFIHLIGTAEGLSS